MKYYLSSYKLGDKTEKLKEMLDNKPIAYIPNAIDFLDPEIVNNEKNMQLLRDKGIRTELLDLREYFGKEKELEKKLYEYGGVMVAGGNTFVLRQAMHLSGFENIIKQMDDFVYAGWSAGICVLAPSLEALQIVDDPTQNPYHTKVIMQGLGILDHIILPHYQSNHPESEAIEQEVAYCQKNNINYKTLKDGDVIIIEK